tara:strand:- start:803 stop:997 length:195 start_codon:yes stop_codon:yes gene_type:complete
MDWSDTYEIVDFLCEKYPDKDPEKLLFLDLMNMVSSLEGFTGKKEYCNERILEAIQTIWIEERD